MVVKFPPVSSEIKPIAHLLKLADNHDERNIVVAYWARMAACLFALQLVPGKKSPQTAELIRALLDWLEETKKANSDNEGIASETIAQSLIEEYALKLFEHADKQDHAQIFNKNTVKLFYSAGILMDVLDQFGSLSDDIREKKIYAKYKAAYMHNCLKAGETPVSGPPKPLDSQDSDGIVHNSQLTEEELSTYTKYTGPLNFDDAVKPVTQPSSSPEDLIPLNPPKPKISSDDSNFPHVPASPTTPQFPLNIPQSLPLPKPSPFDAGLASPSNIPHPVPVSTPTGSCTPTPEAIQKAQKLTKFATSALNYDDTKNAIQYLQQALNLLTFGKEE